MAQENQMKWVNWRAVVALPGGVELKLRAKSIAGKTVMVQSDQMLPKDALCNLTLVVDGESMVRAACRIRDSVLSVANYLVWLDVVECHEGERWLQA